MKLSNDHELMIAVREGDTKMLGILFEKHHKNLYNFFRRQTGNCEASEDLVQEVFFRMLKYRHTYRDDGDFKVWMFSIAHNSRNDYYKKHAHQTIPIDELEPFASSDPLPDKVTEKKSEVEILQHALNALPVNKKELILMSRFHNMGYKEIGTVLGCTEGTVKVRMYRAMKELTDKYLELAGGSHEM